MTVADSGEGIPAEDLPEVFKRFYRGEKSRSKATGGAGLGLAIARGIVRAHQGELTVESRPAPGQPLHICAAVTDAYRAILQLAEVEFLVVDPAARYAAGHEGIAEGLDHGDGPAHVDIRIRRVAAGGNDLVNAQAPIPGGVQDMGAEAWARRHGPDLIQEEGLLGDRGGVEEVDLVRRARRPASRGSS